jgi:hypothetical protein
MKPNEFDELLRQKFDQNDFEYNPGNWDRLEDQLDGRAKKRSIIMWWWVPMAGIAASVALAMAVPSMWKATDTGKPGMNTEMAQKNNVVLPQPAASVPAMAPLAANSAIPYTQPANKSKKHIPVKEEKTTQNFIALAFHDAPEDTKAGQHKNINLLNIGSIAATDNKDKKKTTVEPEGYRTFKPEEEEVQKVPKMSVILSGGINRGSQNNGYMAGATIRKMISDKVYIESDVAFANSNNTQMEGVSVNVPTHPATGKHSQAGKFSSDEGNKTTSTTSDVSVIRQENVTYNLSYAQVTPSIGYQLMKRMSVGVGPDFQQMLVDNRPVAAAGYRGNVQEAPSFDVGFVGKSEYALTKKIKAGVYYRKGVNSVISLNDKYIDRDYLQFQVKCTIFNK